VAHPKLSALNSSALVENTQTSIPSIGIDDVFVTLPEICPVPAARALGAAPSATAMTTSTASPRDP
jgi:hypothetical protein